MIDNIHSKITNREIFITTAYSNDTTRMNNMNYL